jgi:hypothetical protein
LTKQDLLAKEARWPPPVSVKLPLLARSER